MSGGSSPNVEQKHIQTCLGELLKHRSCATGALGMAPLNSKTTPNETGRCNKNPPVATVQSIFLGKLYGRISSKPPGTWSTVLIFSGVFNATSQHLNESAENVPAFHCPLAYLLKSLLPNLVEAGTCSLLQKTRSGSLIIQKDITSTPMIRGILQSLRWSRQSDRVSQKLFRAKHMWKSFNSP